MSPQQVALAWELSQAPVVIPIPGASRPESIQDSVLAADLLLAPEELAAARRELTSAERSLERASASAEKSTNRTSSTRVVACRTASTAIRATSSTAHP